MKNREKLFSDYNPEYGVNEEETWIFQGDENIYKGIYNLVNHMDKITLEKELTVMIKTAVLLRYKLFLKTFTNFTFNKTDEKAMHQNISICLTCTFDIGLLSNE